MKSDNTSNSFSGRGHSSPGAKQIDVKGHSAGFTLIEMSIVLVIIGLIVGGVLVGQDLIRSAGVRAQIAQIEKFNQAANTFRDKYGFLPGDINTTGAWTFGFASRGPYPGQGDGNGIVAGNFDNGSNGLCGVCEGGGETVMFWVDLSAAHLIEGGFNTATATSVPTVTGAAIANYFPSAKIGQGNYIYVYEGNEIGVNVGSGINYFGISSVSNIGVTCQGCSASTPGLTVQQAYNIDRKIDDGLPQFGNVTAQYLNLHAGQGQVWAVAGVVNGPTAPYTTATSGTSSTCFDNGHIAGATQQYSVTQNGGVGANCALSFQFQ